jgi:tetratricopeptide (TPR) repeat protein
MEPRSPDAELPAIDSLWNFEDAAGSEVRFRALLPRAQDDAPYRAELLTQIARSQGLQQRFDEARATLDEADALIKPDMLRARVRSRLERGRVHNSSGDAAGAVPIFEDALRLAQQGELEYLAVDAAHMLGIASPPERAIDWNERAVQLAEQAKDPRARGWVGAISNNLGWMYHELGRHADALRMFEKTLAFHQKGDARREGIARWSIAKMYRHLGRVDEALAIQRALLERPERQNNAAEGYTREEIGECLLALGRSEAAKPELARAWQLLHTDIWLQRDQPARLARLKELGGVE